MISSSVKLEGHEGSGGGLAKDLALRQGRHVSRPSLLPESAPTKSPKKKPSPNLKQRIGRACLSLMLRGKPAKAEWTLILWQRWASGRLFRSRLSGM